MTYQVRHSDSKKMPRNEDVPDWLRCPNNPPCPHAGLFHDIEDYDDPVPRCCAGGCSCGTDRNSQ